MVSNNTLSTDIWNQIRTDLVASAIEVTDGSKVKEASVSAAYNDKNTSRPQIIIYPSDRDESTWKFGSFEGKKFINISIEVYYSNTSGLDQLEDAVTTVLKETLIPGIELIGITSAYTFNNPAFTKYHSKMITFTYDKE